MKTHKNLVKIVASFAPWLAPAPSAFFVGRSAMAHLAVPFPVAVVIAAIIETLGVGTVHTALWMSDWNTHKRKTDPAAPVAIGVALGCVYLVATIGLTVVLEVAPSLAIVAPAIFPALAVVGAINLALISQQENREEAAAHERAERIAQRTHKKDAVEAHPGILRGALSDANRNARIERILAINQGRKAHKAQIMQQLLDVYQGDPTIGVTDAGRALGVHRNTVYAYLDELETAGRIRRNGEGVEVVA